MPPKFKFTKDDIINAAYRIVSLEGEAKLTARALGSSLNSSSKVIFGLFKGMEEVKNEVIKLAYLNFRELMVDCLKNATPSRPAYLTCALAYIKLAKDDPNIFKLLTMRDTTLDKESFNNESRPIIAKFISEKSKISFEDAIMVHDKYWFFMHGMAVAIASKSVSLDDAYIEDALKENYLSLVRNVREK